MQKFILFVCVENSARSQMAEAFFNQYNKNPLYAAKSAGIRPAAAVKPHAITVMKEKGIGISNQQPRMLTSDLVERAHLVITMGCLQDCPVTSPEKTIDWKLEDPAGKSLESFRKVRDEIEKLVLQLIERLD